MTDIQEVSPDFQKLNKSEHCIILHMKNDTKIAITSPVCTSIYIHFSYPLGAGAELKGDAVVGLPMQNLYGVGKIYIASALLYCRGLCVCLGQA